ncbi:MAG TPA: hypothetical protein VGE39_10515 [Prosthecobacter sp.]
MPLPPLAASDFDPFQGAIIVIALLAGFIKWLWENWRAKSDAAQRDYTPQDPDELRRREEAWQRQVGQGQGQPQPPPPQRRAPPVAPSAWDELRKAWDELKETARQSQNPQQPPPQPLRPQPSAPPQRQPYSQPQQKQPKRHSVGADLAAAESRLAATRAAAEAASAAAAERRAPSAPPVVERRSGPTSALLGTLQNLRHDPVLLRQAVLLHEILGPPKALQSSTDPAT